MEKYHLSIPAVLLERLRKLSERTGLSMADHIRRAIEQYLDRMGA